MVQCYYKNDDSLTLIRSINSGVCVSSGSSSGFFSCCFPWDKCLPDGLCQATEGNTYYTALCTDQTLQDESCQKGCSKSTHYHAGVGFDVRMWANQPKDGLYRTGLTYNATDSLWACCNAEDASCSTSTNVTLELPAPEVLLQSTMTIVDFIPTSSEIASTGPSTTSAIGVASTTSRATSSSAQASSADSASVPRSDSGLSVGATAGISVGVAVVVISGIVCLVFWLLTRRKRKNQQDDGGQQPPGSTSTTHTVPPVDDDHVVEKHGTSIVEAPTPGPRDQDPGERANRTGMHELN